MSTTGDRPIYIGGTDRSGKTTLAGFLTSHSAIAIPPIGTNLWTNFYRRFGSLGVDENRKRAIETVLCYDRVRALDLDDEQVREDFLGGPPTYGRLFGLPLAHYAARAGKTRWGAQTGMLERWADDLYQAYPHATIIHMIRDPRDRYAVARSRAARGRGGIGPATARWRHSAELAHRNLRRHPGRYLVIRFEDLVLETDKTLRMICEFVGEDYEPGMIEMPDAPQRHRRLADQKSTDQPGLLSSEFIGIFDGRVSPEELRFLQGNAHREMERHGYELVPIHMGWEESARYALRTWPEQQGRMRIWFGREAISGALPQLAGRRFAVEQAAPHAKRGPSR